MTSEYVIVYLPGATETVNCLGSLVVTSGQNTGMESNTRTIIR